MKINTKLTKVSRNVKKQKGFINPGIYKGSTMIFDNFDDYPAMVTDPPFLRPV